MSFKDLFKKLLLNDYLIGAIILGAFLCTNAYIYGWDDQHLEIPLLKHLIDSTLYNGDYYVESLQKNFTTYMYPLLSKVISVEQIPSVYLILYLLSRYVMFLFTFKLWVFLAKDRWVAFFCSLMMFLVGGTEEFLYRTFSHQEFALAFIIAGIYFFYRERFFITAILMGIATNFNALYGMFPMTYVCFYLLFFHREQKIKLCLLAGIVYMLAASPWFWWAVPKAYHGRVASDPTIYKDWIELFYIACPQNYLFASVRFSEFLGSFKVALNALTPFIFLAVLYAFHLIINPVFRRDLKAQAIVIVGFGWLVVSFFFSYIVPNRTVLDLNLIRNAQYVNYLLMGYSTFFMFQVAKDRNIGIAFWMGLLMIFLSLKGMVGVFALAIIGLFILINEALKDQNPVTRKQHLTWSIAFLVVASVLAVLVFKLLGDPEGINWAHHRMKRLYWVVGLCGLGYGLGKFIKPLKDASWLRILLVVIPIGFMFVHYVKVHQTYRKIVNHGSGFWQMQRNWEDMQYYVKQHTPKESLLLVPYNMEMGGFRIHSNRKIVCSYRDCGIVGFDYQALLEWQKRVNDIEPFKVFAQGGIEKALKNAIVKYKVNYIVFMNYYQPKKSNQILKKIYENSVYSLYQVTINPV